MSAHDPHFLEDQPEQADAWHRHAPAEGTPQAEHTAQANPAVLAVTFLVLTIGLVVTIAVILVYYHHTITRFKQEMAEVVDPTAEHNPVYAAVQYQAAARASLDEYGWVDPVASDALRVPVSVAIDRVVARYAERRVSGD